MESLLFLERINHQMELNSIILDSLIIEFNRYVKMSEYNLPLKLSNEQFLDLLDPLGTLQEHEIIPSIESFKVMSTETIIETIGNAISKIIEFIINIFKSIGKAISNFFNWLFGGSSGSGSSSLDNTVKNTEQKIKKTEKVVEKVEESQKKINTKTQECRATIAQKNISSDKLLELVTQELNKIRGKNTSEISPEDIVDIINNKDPGILSSILLKNRYLERNKPYYSITSSLANLVKYILHDTNLKVIDELVGTFMKFVISGNALMILNNVLETVDNLVDDVQKTLGSIENLNNSDARRKLQDCCTEMKDIIKTSSMNLVKSISSNIDYRQIFDLRTKTIPANSKNNVEIYILSLKPDYIKFFSTVLTPSSDIKITLVEYNNILCKVSKMCNVYRNLDDMINRDTDIVSKEGYMYLFNKKKEYLEKQCIAYGESCKRSTEQSKKLEQLNTNVSEKLESLKKYITKKFSKRREIIPEIYLILNLLNEFRNAYYPGDIFKLIINSSKVFSGLLNISRGLYFAYETIFKDIRNLYEVYEEVIKMINEKIKLEVG